VRQARRRERRGDSAFFLAAASRTRRGRAPPANAALSSPPASRDCASEAVRFRVTRRRRAIARLIDGADPARDRHGIMELSQGIE